MKKTLLWLFAFGLLAGAARAECPDIPTDCPYPSYRGIRVGNTTGTAGGVGDVNISGSFMQNGVPLAIGGTLTGVSVATANGFSGSSSGGVTPALTLTTTVNGALKGSAGALYQAAAVDLSNGVTGSGLVVLGTAPTIASPVLTGTLSGAAVTALLNNTPLTGIPTIPTASPGTNTTQAASTAFVQAAVAASTVGVATFNGRTGTVTLTSGDVTTALTYTPAPTASPTFTGTVTIPGGASITGYATLASPALSGIPVAPTASPGTNTTQIATTAFTTAAVAVETSRATTAEALLAPKASPTFTGTVTIPGGASISGYATLASPTFTGTPAAPTAAAGTNTTQLATTAYTMALAGNVLNAQTTTYAGVSGDCGKTVSLGGSAFYTMSVGAASGFATTCVMTVTNTDTGRAKTISVNGLSDFLLYPLQTMTLRNEANTWNVTRPNRWKTPGSFTLYVNSSGSSANDGLAVGSPKASVQQAFDQITSDFDFKNDTGGNSITVQMGSNDTTGVHYGAHDLVGATSGGNITLDGGGFTLSNAGDTDDALHLFFGATMYVQNITITPGTNHGAISLEHGATAFLKSSVTLGASGAGSSGGAQIQVQTAARLEIDNNYTIAGSAGYHIYVHDNGVVRVPAAVTATFSGDATYGTVVVAAAGGVANLANLTFALGGHSIAGKQYDATSGTIFALGGAPNTAIPGSTGGTTTNGGNADNIMAIPAVQSSSNAVSTDVGYYTQSTVLSGSAVALSSGVTANVTTLTLGAGDWSVSGQVNFQCNASATVTATLGGTSGTSATFGTAPGTYQLGYYGGATPFSVVSALTAPAIPLRYSLNSPTTIYLVANSTFGVSACTAYGIIEAWRVR